MDNCCEKNYYKLCKPIPDCLETLNIQTLQLDTNIIAVILDKFGRRYAQPVSTASNGLAVIDLEDEDIFPEFLLNPYSGIFFLIIEDMVGNIIPFVIDGVSYDGLQLEVQNITPKKDSFYIDVYDTPIGAY